MKGGADLMLQQEYFSNKGCTVLLVGRTNYVGDIIVHKRPNNIWFNRNTCTIVDESQEYLFRKFLSPSKKKVYKKEETTCVFHDKSSFDNPNPCGNILLILNDCESD